MSDKRYTAIVPQGLDDANRVIAGRTLGDIVYFLAAPLFGWFFLTMFEIIPTVVLLLMITIHFVIAGVLYRKAGRNTSVREYLNAAHHRLTLPTYAPAETSEPPESGDQLRPDGGRLGDLIADFTTDPDNISMWADDTAASEYTKVHSVYPQFNVIQREDGTYLTAIEISGTNLYLKSRSAKSNVIEQFTDVLREIDFDHQLFVTTKNFDVDEHADAHAEQAYHDDITNNPILKELHHEYQSQVINDRRIQQTRQRTVYAILPYQPSAAAINDNDEPTDSQQPEDQAELERRQEAMGLLQDRRQKYISLISNITGVSAAPVDYQTHLGELVGHWQSPMEAEPTDVPASPLIPPKSHDRDDSDGLLA